VANGTRYLSTNSTSGGTNTTSSSYRSTSASSSSSSSSSSNDPALVDCLAYGFIKRLIAKQPV